MKRKIILVILLGIFATATYADGLKAYLSYAAFNTPDNTPYLETYLTIKGSSVNHIALENGNFQGRVEVQIILRTNDSIVNFAKYELAGPLITDTLTGILNFLDVQRFSLGNGNFDIELKLRDINSSEEPLTSYDQYTINFPQNENTFSDIEFLNSFEISGETNNLVKNGYQLVPYIFNYFPAEANTLSFYSELYNNVIGEDNEGFLLSYYIRPFEINKKLDKYSFMKRKTAEHVNVIIGKIDINELPSGNYLLVLEARNKKNEIITTKETFFQRYNPNAEFNLSNIYTLEDLTNSFVNDLGNHDTLAMYISWLRPISTDIEKSFAQNLTQPDSDIDEMKKYFLNFWAERNNSNPLDEWLEYRINVIKTNNSFKTQITQGFDTDRGRVYLQYGAPDAIAQSYNEPHAFPYEIWHYHQMPDNQKNTKFVFYTQDISTNDFQLIHSTAIGELNNYKWGLWINSRSTANLNDVDAGSQDRPYTGRGEIWGGKQNDYYTLPR